MKTDEAVRYVAEYTGPVQGTQPMIRVTCGKIVIHVRAQPMVDMEPSARSRFVRDLADLINEHMNLTKYEVPSDSAQERH
jgi:hypothetical protein